VHAALLLTDISRIPDALSVIFRLRGAWRNEIRSQQPLFAGKSPDSSPRSAETRCFAFTKACLCCHRLSHLTRSPVHSGAGGARSRAISDRMSANICRGTATSAI
jgi:hypothetical protein